MKILLGVYATGRCLLSDKDANLVPIMECPQLLQCLITL